MECSCCRSWTVYFLLFKLFESCPFMVATNKTMSLSTSLMTLALLNLHACPVTLSVIQDETLKVSFDSTYFSDLCLRLAIIGSCCYDVPACTRVNIFTFIGSIILIGKDIEIKIRFLGLANVLKAWIPHNRPVARVLPGRS